MRTFHRIRRWQRAAMSCLLCLSLHALALAQTETSTPSKNPAHTSTAKAKHSTGAHAPAKRTSFHTAAQTTKTKSAHGKKNLKASKTTKKRGQQVIDAERARAIQEALIREHYMEGEPSGTWDTATQEAMQKYQSDQGWQVKTTPDSRALIKLGLGPSHDHLLNPESAMSMPASPSAPDPKPGASQTPPENHAPRR